MSGVAPDSLALTNTSGATESYTVDDVTPSGDQEHRHGDAGRRRDAVGLGAALSGAGFDPIVVRGERARWR